MKLQNISRIVLTSFFTLGLAYSTWAQSPLVNNRDQMKFAEYRKFASFFRDLNASTQELQILNSAKAPGPIVSLSTDGSSRGFWYIDSRAFAGLICKGELPSVVSNHSVFLAATNKAQQIQNQRCQRAPYNALGKLNTKTTTLRQESILNDFSKITKDSEQTAVQMYEKIEQSLFGNFFHIHSMRISLEADMGAVQRRDLAIYKLNVRITERNRSNKKVPRECSAYVEINKKNESAPGYFRFWGCI